MGKFTNGVLIGMGISLLIAPKSGKEMRSILAERIQSLRGLPTEQGELEPVVQQHGTLAAPTGTSVHDEAQSLALHAASVQHDLSAVTPPLETGMPQTGQGDVSPTLPLRRVRLIR